MTEIERRLADLAAEVLQIPAETAIRASRATTPGWDSLSHIRLLLAIEEEFGVRFSAEEFAGAQSMGEIATLIGRKR